MTLPTIVLSAYIPIIQSWRICVYNKGASIKPSVEGIEIALDISIGVHKGVHKGVSTGMYAGSPSIQYSGDWKAKVSMLYPCQNASRDAEQYTFLTVSYMLRTPPLQPGVA